MNNDNNERLTEDVTKLPETPSCDSVASKKEKVGFLPKVHLTKRDGVPYWGAVLVRAIAILAALIVCAIITVVVTHDNPLSIYATIFKGAFGKGRGFVTLHEIAILLCVSLAVTPAFRMHFWNIGAEGQTLIGGLATALVMFAFHDKMNVGALAVLMLVAGVIAGAVWGVIPAIFKAQWNTNETLFTLMMNYVAIQLIEYFLKVADKSGSNVVGPRLLGNGLPNLFGVQYLLNIVVVAFLTVILYIYLRYSKHGYEISVVGESENTARYIGINVKKVVIRTMILSGALCGLAGFLIVGGASHSINKDIVSGRGFTAIMVSWLAKFNPLMMILTTLLLVFMERGADEVSTMFGLNQSFSDIITGIILFFIIGCEFFIRYRVHLDRPTAQGKEEN
ncbi:MAG: ABC transporter permease [Clostridia bacterium]|nr:ABC transporter permease [Clostridia bacterium]